MDKRTRVTLYAVCGAYLFYMAYKMFQTVLEVGVADSMISLVFSILFVIMGIIIWVFTYRLSREIKKEDEEARQESSQEAEDECTPIGEVTETDSEKKN